MMRLIKEYTNGNAQIRIYDDGTRICHTEDDSFDFEYPLNMDIKITNKCYQGCPACHEQSTPEGKHADLEDLKFLKNWLPGCEVAYGGGSVTEHPQFEEILKMTKEAGLIANTTLHVKEFIEHGSQIKRWQSEGLIYGLGVSWPMTGETPDMDKLVDVLKDIDNVVFHVIVGIVTRKDMENIITVFRRAKKPAKVLLLGYKNFGRGKQLFSEVIERRIKEFSDNYQNMIDGLTVVSFDNLAIEQLDVKSRIPAEDWPLFYQGKEGSGSMYIDAVNKVYAVCSIAEERYPLTDSVKGMFAKIKSIAGVG